MKRRTFIGFGALVAITGALGAACSAGVGVPAQLTTEKWPHEGAIDAAIVKYQQKYRVPGLAVVAYRGSRELFSKGVGWADREKQKPATPDTIFRLASVSKAVSGVLAMDLRNDRKLVLSRPIRQYVPELPPHHIYTVQQILSHQSGVRHYNNGTKVDPPAGFQKPADGHYSTALEATKLFRNDPLVMRPGTRAEYSTHAFTILAAAMEKSTGRVFYNIATGKFDDWGIPTLRPEGEGFKAARAQIYEVKNGTSVVAERDDLSWKYAGGGFESSARDLTLLGRKLLERKILNQSELDLMWTRQNSATGLTNTGLGWSIGTLQGKRVAGKDGDQNGAASYWLLMPDDGIVVSVLSNQRDHNPRGLARYVAATALLPNNGTPGNFNP